MLYLVRSESKVPWGMETHLMKELGVQQRARSLELQESGVCLHHWRAAGQHLSFAVYDAGSNAELQEILTSLPLYPYTYAEVVPLVTPA